MIYIINKCKSNPKFQAGVYTNHKDVRAQCFDFAINMLEKIYDVPNCLLPVKTTRYPLAIQFENGSRIVFPIPNDGARGCRFCTVLIGDDIEDYIKHCIILPTIISYDRINPDVVG